MILEKRLYSVRCTRIGNPPVVHAQKKGQDEHDTSAPVGSDDAAVRDHDDPPVPPKPKGKDKERSLAFQIDWSKRSHDATSPAGKKSIVLSKKTDPSAHKRDLENPRKEKAAQAG